MTYTAKTAAELRNQAGSLLQKVASENNLIETELSDYHTRTPLAERKFITLTLGTGTNTAVATAGVDLASGSNISVFGLFFPRPVTLVNMHDYLTEAYVRDTSDAKIEVYTEAGTPVKLFTRTLTAGGEAARAVHVTAPETGKSEITAGTGLELRVTNTGSSSGTGHAIVVIEYIDKT